MAKTFYINTSIPYVNARPHIGHAMEWLYADVIARVQHEAGEYVRFVTGVDEHGQKVATTAAERGMNPQTHVDEMSQFFVQALQVLNISNNDFVRTSSLRHKMQAQETWKKLIASGDLEKREYQGLYCVGCEAFKTEKELEDGKCPIHKTEPENVAEENYFFRLSRYQQQLQDFYEKNSQFVTPATRFNEIKNIVDGGLEDVSVSRSKESVTWGIAVPNDDAQVMYVWFEALLNYITAADGQWPSDVIVVGKDINRFHSIIFPAMLLAAGMEIPKQIAVHGFITVEGEKMSKSLGNVIDPVELIEKYGVDPVRYFLLREIPFSGDGDFSYKRLEEVYQSELANGLGNLLSRVTNMVEKYFDGKIEAKPRAGDWGAAQATLYTESVEQYKFGRAIESIVALINDSNEYIDQTKPWELAKTDMDQLRTVLSHLVYALQIIGQRLKPLIPDTADTVLAAVTADTITKSEPLFPRLNK